MSFHSHLALLRAAALTSDGEEGAEEIAERPPAKKRCACYTYTYRRVEAKRILCRAGKKTVAKKDVPEPAKPKAKRAPPKDKAQ